MKVNQKRLHRQQGNIRQWVSRGCRGTLEACTGYGKTFVAILIIREMNRRHPDRRTLVLVPTIDLEEQWQQQVRIHNLRHVTVLVKNTAIIRMKALHQKGKRPRTHLLVLDEVHNFAAPEASLLFTGMDYLFLLGLSATIERNDGGHTLLEQYCPVFDTITLQEALREGYVAPFRVFNLGIDLPMKERMFYEKITETFHKNFSVFSHQFALAMSCVREEGAARSLARSLGWEGKASQSKAEHDRCLEEQSRLIWLAALNWNRAMQQRKTFLYNHPRKLDYTLRILQQVPRRAITFSQTLEAPLLLAKAMPGTSLDYGSHLTRATRRKRLKQFVEDPAIQVIHTSKALDEGKDVPALSLAIILSSSSAERQDLQRSGRAIRWEEGKQAFIINLYMKDTQDERWLRERQKKSVNITWINSLDALLATLTGKGYSTQTKELTLTPQHL